MRGDTLLYAFNRGLIAKQALARVDLKRTALSAEIMTNWMPRAFGSMSLRPGLQYLGGTNGSADAIGIPFVFATDDTALLELTDGAMRVWLTDAVLTAPTVATAVVNGTFDTNLTSWNDNDAGAAVSEWVTGGYMGLTGSGANAAIRDQNVSLAAGDQNTAHRLAIIISRGTVEVSIGSTSGGAEYLGPVSLSAGSHSIAFTPATALHIRISSTTAYQTLVDSVTIAAGGPVVLATPWTAADLQNVRWEQSGDVVFVCDGAHQQRRIERRGSSWSVVIYQSLAGPFLGENLTTTTLTAAALTGSTTLTASKALFSASHVGALFRLESLGQNVTATITSAVDTWTDTVRVTGVSGSRLLSVAITMTDAATVTLQRALDPAGDWNDVRYYTASTSTTYSDGMDNQTWYYRIGVKAAHFVANTVAVSLASSSGYNQGTALVTGYTSSTVVSVAVLENFGSTGATSIWWEGQWSDYRGWPSAVSIYDGRLWWAGHDKVNGSVSDAYTNFDDNTEGDSGPISRNIGSGPVDYIGWLLPLNQLLIGTQGSELGAKASSLEEPLTPSAFSLKTLSTQGSASVPAVKVDTNGIFVQRSGKRVYELSAEDTGYSYKANDLTAIVPDLGSPGLVRLVGQRQPDTRIHCVRSDGTVAILVYDKLENINCWVNFETDGEVVDAVVLPGTDEDLVYYFVRRNIGGTDAVYLEKWALESEIIGAATTKLSDSCIYAAGPLTVVTGLDHLEGETVVVWGNSKDLGSYVVASGAITLTESATGITVGLPYTAQFKSSKFAFSGRYENVTLTHPKHVDHVGLVLANTHAQGIRYGQDFNHLDDLPLREGYALVDPDSVWEDYEEGAIEVNGTWEPDARLCLEAASPRPATVVACMVGVSGHAK